MNSSLSASPASASALLAGVGDSLSFQGLNSLSARAQANPRDPATIRAVSSQFEALLVQQMLQSAEATKLGPDMLGGTSGPLFQSMFTQQIAATVSQGQGLGLGSFLARELSARWGSGHAAPAAAPQAPAMAAPQRQGIAAPGVGATAATTAPADEAPTAPIASPAAASRSAPAASAGGGGPTLQQARSFLASVLPSARAAARALGVSPLGILAQAALETGWGRHAPGNNLFGIKASDTWHGASLQSLTHEFAGGLQQLGQAAFRAYRSVSSSVHDYTSLLESPRYAAVRGHGSDVGAFARALQHAGYASDPGYAAKLLDVAHGPTMRDALASLASAGGSSPALP